MQKLTESKVFLPDFITMTNYCESLGYEVEMIRSKKGVTCDVYLNNELQKVGSIIYNSCLEAQKESYSKLYMVLTNK